MRRAAAGTDDGKRWRALRDRAGNAALEAALVAPVLALLAVGIADYGLAIHRKMQIQHAAQAGADYAMKYGFDSSAITGAVTAATAVAGIAAVPAPAEACGCVAGNTLAAASCGSLCPDGTAAGTYVTVSAQGAYATLIPYPGIPAEFTFNASAVTRTR